MGLQSSGQISLNNIATEYGGSQPHQLSEYYSKGNAPSSGEIQIAADFYGTSNIVTENAYSNNFQILVGHRGASQVIWDDGNYYRYKVSDEGVHRSRGAMANSFRFYYQMEYDEDYNTIGQVKSNCPFPAHNGTLGGWRYFLKRGENAIYSYNANNGGFVFRAHRTTSSSYPY